VTPALWFFDHGVHVFPVHGKEPAVAKGTSWKDYNCSREQAARFRSYAVPLGRLAVPDTDNPADSAWVTSHLPPTPFRVRTARGWHSYYRLTGEAPHFIHRDGHTIEFRQQGQYVVGPGSVHPSGAIYTASEWSWCWDDIPFFPVDFVFNDGSCPKVSVGGTGGPFVLPEAIVEPCRHETLHKLMRSLVANGVPFAGALTVCRMENRTRCHPPLKDNALDEGIDNTLDVFLRRAYKQKDRADFVRSPKTGWALAGGLLELGLSVEAALAAVRSISPDFDPETSE
jgi:hypothetical protein